MGLKLNTLPYRIFVIFQHAERKNKKAAKLRLPYPDGVCVQVVLCPGCIGNLSMTKHKLVAFHLHFPKRHQWAICKKRQDFGVTLAHL